MQSFLLKASPNKALGQADGLGFAYVMVVDEEGTAGVMPGDEVDLTAVGGPASAPLVGVKFPWDDPNGPFNGPYALVNGVLAIKVTVPSSPVPGPGPFVPEGLLICSSITASGFRSPFGGEVSAYNDPAAPPPPPPSGSPATLAAAVLASFLSGTPVANAFDPSQQQAVTYTQQVMGWSGPVTVWAPESLTQAAAANIARLIGGTVVQVVPPSPFSMAAQGAPPQVTGVQITVNGATKTAPAGAIAQSFALFSPGTPVATVEAAILACFA
jgi:hypothetical protein